MAGVETKQQFKIQYSIFRETPSSNIKSGGGTKVTDRRYSKEISEHSMTEITL
jgi:hypothetical protein